MALIKCKECGQEISTKAESCPKCGAKRRSQNIGCGTVLVALILGWIVIEILTPAPPTGNQTLRTQPGPAAIPKQSEWEKIAKSQVPGDIQLVAEIRRMEWFEACRAWGVAARANGPGRRSEALREFLLHDASLNDLDLAHVGKRSVAVGMTACGTFAALGMPENLNTTTTAHATRQQLVYRSRNMYVYTEAKAGHHNGTVRTIQQ